MLDRYTAKTYNNYGWIVVNKVLTENEWSEYNNKLDEELKNKSNKNYNGETIIGVGEHSSDITALVYVKGTAGNPVISKVVRVNTENKSVSSILLNEVFAYERENYRIPLEVIESDYGQKLFSTFERKDFSTLQEIKQQNEGRVSKTLNSDSRE